MFQSIEHNKINILVFSLISFIIKNLKIKLVVRKIKIEDIFLHILKGLKESLTFNFYIRLIII